MELVVAEVILTSSRILLEHGLFSRNSRLQILASLSLGYAIFPNKARFVSWGFFLKGIEAHKSLKKVRHQSSMLHGS